MKSSFRTNPPFVWMVLSTDITAEFGKKSQEKHFSAPIQVPKNSSPKVNVWMGISSERIHGPFFFDGNITGENYLDMLQRGFLPQLSRFEKRQAFFSARWDTTSLRGNFLMTISTIVGLVDVALWCGPPGLLTYPLWTSSCGDS